MTGQGGTTEPAEAEQASVRWTIALIGEDMLRWLMIKVTLGVAALVGLAGVAAESPPVVLRAASVATALAAFGWAIAEAVRCTSTRRRQWTFILSVLLACGSLFAAAMLVP